MASLQRSPLAMLNLNPTETSSIAASTTCPDELELPADGLQRVVSSPRLHQGTLQPARVASLRPQSPGQTSFLSSCSFLGESTAPSWGASPATFANPEDDVWLSPWKFLALATNDKGPDEASILRPAPWLTPQTAQNRHSSSLLSREQRWSSPR